MSLTPEPIPVRLRDDGRGGLRVGQTRVGLESVWHLHHAPQLVGFPPLQ